jgi:hypothetical protein
MAKLMFETMRNNLKASLPETVAQAKLNAWLAKGVGLMEEGTHPSWYKGNEVDDLQFNHCLAYVLLDQGREQMLWPLIGDVSDLDVRKTLVCRGQSLLLLAVGANNGKAIQHLVNSGWPVDEDVNGKGAALAWAVKHQKVDAVDALVQASADWMAMTKIVSCVGFDSKRSATYGTVHTFPWAMALTQPDVKILKLALASKRTPTPEQWKRGKTANWGANISEPVENSLLANVVNGWRFNKGWWKTLVESGAYDKWWSPEVRNHFQEKLAADPEKYAFAYQALEKRMVGAGGEAELKHSHALMAQEAPLPVLSKWFTATRAKAYWEDISKDERETLVEDRQITSKWVAVCLKRPGAALIMKDALNLNRQEAFWKTCVKLMELPKLNGRGPALHETKLDTLEKPMRDVFQLHTSQDERVLPWQNRALWTAVTQNNAKDLLQWRALLQWAVDSKQMSPEVLLNTLRSATTEGPHWWKHKEYEAWTHDLERTALTKRVGKDGPTSKKTDTYSLAL